MNKKKKIIIIVIAIIVVIAVVTGVVVYQLNKDEESSVELKDESDLIERNAIETTEEPESYEAQIIYTEDTSEDELNIESTELEENAVLVTNASIVSLSGANIVRSAEDSEDEKGAKQFGIGAAVLVKNGILNITDSQISTTSKGAAALYAYTDGVITAENIVITTEGDNAGGIHASTGGSITATNCTVTTSGRNSATIRSENDGGLMEIEGGTYTTYGEESPAIYCVATITAENATLSANNAEAIFIDGAHSVTLDNCDVMGSLPSDNYKYNFGGEPLVYAIGIGQTSVKDETKEANLIMTGGTLTSKTGGLIYISNAIANIVLENVEINISESNDFFLQCTGNNNTPDISNWGNLGSNGGTCDITIINQEADGDVIWDSISRVDFEITEGSTFKGAVINDDTAIEEVENVQTTGSCSITIDESSTWVVTENSTVATLENAGTIVDENGNTVTIQSVNGKVYVEGNSSYVVTVNTYSE